VIILDSLEQMKAIAEQCQLFSPVDKGALRSHSVLQHGIDCTMCRHYDGGLCEVKDEILINMDQT